MWDIYVRTLLEKFWRISLYEYVTEDAIAKLYVTYKVLSNRGEMVENLVT